MKTIIIFLNISLISLLLYYFLRKTNIIIENLANCPTDKRNTSYKQSAQSSAHSRQINVLSNKLKRLEGAIGANSMRLLFASGQQKNQLVK